MAGFEFNLINQYNCKDNLATLSQLEKTRGFPTLSRLTEFQSMKPTSFNLMSGESVGLFYIESVKHRHLLIGTVHQHHIRQRQHHQIKGFRIPSLWGEWEEQCSDVCP